MQRILIMNALLIAFSSSLFAQNDYFSLDKQTYGFYLQGDYENLKKTSEKMLDQGIDYYYLRMRIGILSYNKQLYPSAVKHFTKAIEFNAWDTISREYIYYSYLFAGRKTDAKIYLNSIPHEKKNSTLKKIKGSGLSDIYISSLYNIYQSTLYENNNLYYEAVKSSLSANVGLESYFSSNFKGNFIYTYYNKTGTVYSSTNSGGKDLNFNQNQLFAKLTGMLFPGWEFSGYGHLAIYSNVLNNTQASGRRSSGKSTAEYLGGINVSKNGWKVRGGVNFSYSNFSSSSQIRGEGYLTYLPFGNINLYLTSGGMYQTDQNWGSTYQLNQEIGFKIFKALWLETGTIMGNSFLYARNQGSFMNNSFQIPSISIYGNFTILLSSCIRLTLSPFYTENHIYSWDLAAYTKTDKLVLNSFGGSIKLIINNK